MCLVCPSTGTDTEAVLEVRALTAALRACVSYVLQQALARLRQLLAAGASYAVSHVSLNMLLFKDTCETYALKETVYSFSLQARPMLSL